MTNISPTDHAKQRTGIGKAQGISGGEGTGRIEEMRGNPDNLTGAQAVVAQPRFHAEARDVQKVTFIRGAVETDYIPSEVIVLFDGNKDTRVGPPGSTGFPTFLVGDKLRVPFKDVVQCEILETMDRTPRLIDGVAVPMLRDVLGTYEIVFADPGVPNKVQAGVRKSKAEAKIVAYQFTFGEVPTDGVISELVVKLYIDVDSTVDVQVAVDIKSKKDGGDDSITIHPEFIDTPIAAFTTLNTFGGTNLRDIDVSGHLSGKFRITSSESPGGNAAIVRAHLLLTGATERNVLLDETRLEGGDTIWVSYGGLGDEPANTLRIEGIAAVPGNQASIRTQGRGVN